MKLSLFFIIYSYLLKYWSKNTITPIALSTFSPRLFTVIDFKKAFDFCFMQHHMLLNKLAQLNLDWSFIKWVKSYLTSREQMLMGSNRHHNV